jgi:Peptidase A4 family
MVRRWCIPVAAFALVSGSMLASGAASASTAVPTVRPAAIQPGGVMRHVVKPFTTPGIHPDQTSSTNWSGYAATGSNGEFTSVSASWVEPKATCSSGDQYAAYWVGLDGYSSSTVEQTGSETDCDGRTPEYYAWYEMYPGPSEDFSNTVEPGDHFSASVTSKGSGKFTLTITDSTQGWTKTENETLKSADLSSAEVIIEAPCCTNSGGILPLADFGTVNLTNSEANGSPIGNYNPTGIYIESTGGTKEDSVSSLSGGTNFSATWLAKSPRRK